MTVVDTKLRLAIWLHHRLLAWEPRLGPVLLEAVSRVIVARQQAHAQQTQHALDELRNAAARAAAVN